MKETKCRFCGTSEKMPDKKNLKWAYINKKHKVAICNDCADVFKNVGIFDDMCEKYDKGDFSYDEL